MEALSMSHKAVSDVARRSIYGDARAESSAPRSCSRAPLILGGAVHSYAAAQFSPAVSASLPGALSFASK